jgi:hypothetical protein
MQLTCPHFSSPSLPRSQYHLPFSIYVPFSFFPFLSSFHFTYPSLAPFVLPLSLSLLQLSSSSFSLFPFPFPFLSLIHAILFPSSETLSSALSATHNIFPPYASPFSCPPFISSISFLDSSFPSYLFLSFTHALPTLFPSLVIFFSLSRDCFLPSL